MVDAKKLKNINNKFEKKGPKHMKNININLPKSAIPQLLGIMNLGLEMHHFCAILSFPKSKYMSGFSWDRWTKSGVSIREEIKKQTGISEDETGFVNEEALKIVQGILNKQFKIEEKKYVDRESTIKNNPAEI